MSEVHFPRLLHFMVGTHTIPARKKKYVHIERLVHLGTDLSICTKVQEMYLWIKKYMLEDRYILVPI